MQRLHHHAYVVSDQARTRQFYEDVLGLPLVATWCESENIRGRDREYCHTFFALDDGSALAFFQFADPEDGAELALDSSRSLNHVALAVDSTRQDEIRDSLSAAGVPFRVTDHGYCVSLYVSDPDGLTVEFTVDALDAITIGEWQATVARAELDRWLAGNRTPNNSLRSIRRAASST